MCGVMRLRCPDATQTQNFAGVYGLEKVKAGRKSFSIYLQSFELAILAHPQHPEPGKNDTRGLALPNQQGCPTAVASGSG